MNLSTKFDQLYYRPDKMSDLASKLVRVSACILLAAILKGATLESVSITAKSKLYDN